MKRRTLCSIAGATLLALAGTLGAGTAAAQTRLKWAQAAEDRIWFAHSNPIQHALSTPAIRPNY